MESIISIEDFKKNYPRAFTKFQNIKGKYIQCTNVAIEDFLLEFGLGIVVQPVFNSEDIFIGFCSKIKIYPDNLLNLEIESISIIEDYKQFKNSDKAQKRTTLYALEYLEEKLAFKV